MFSVGERDLFIQMLSEEEFKGCELRFSRRSGDVVEKEKKVKLFSVLFDALNGEQVSYNTVIAKCSMVTTCVNGDKILEEREIKSQGLITALEKEIEVSGRKNIAEWAVNWLEAEFEQELSLLSNMEDVTVTVATSQQSRQVP